MYTLENLENKHYKGERKSPVNSTIHKIVLLTFLYSVQFIFSFLNLIIRIYCLILLFMYIEIL